jgi:hypothetical protein
VCKRERERERETNTCENNDEHAMGWGANIKAHRQEGRKIAFVLTNSAQQQQLHWLPFTHLHEQGVKEN